MGSGEFQTFDDSDHDTCLCPNGFEQVSSSSPYICEPVCQTEAADYCGFPAPTVRSRFSENFDLHIPQMIFDGDFSMFWVSTMDVPVVVQITLPTATMVRNRGDQLPAKINTVNMPFILRISVDYRHPIWI